jgi:tellurite resistance protein TehA-like permease
MSLKDVNYFVVFSVPILFFAVQMDWSFDGISDLVFGLLLFLVFPAILFILQVYCFLHLDRKLRQAGRVKSKTPFVISYCAIVIFDLLISAQGALDTYRGVSGSAFNVIMLFYLPLINIIIIALIYAVTIMLSYSNDTR